MHPDTEAQLAGVLRGVLEQTKNQTLRWTATDKEESFVGAIGERGFRVEKEFDQNDQWDGITFSILGAEGDPLESLRYYPAYSPQEAPYWAPSLIDLHEYARRSALDIQSVLDDLLESLGESKWTKPSDKPPPDYNYDEEPF